MAEAGLVCLKYEPETGRARPVPEGCGGMDGVAAAMRDRYLAAAEAVMAGSSGRLHVAFDETMVSKDGHAGRHVALAAESSSLAEAAEAAGGRPVGRFDGIVVLGPEFIGWDGDEGRMREVVAGDLAYLLERLFPVRGDGPIEPLMPWLVRLAGSVLLQGAKAADDGEARAERAIARALKSAAAALYDSWNAGGQLVTDHPAFPYLADEIARESLNSARTLVSPVSFEAAARMVHDALARALANLGVRIEARAA